MDLFMKASALISIMKDMKVLYRNLYYIFFYTYYFNFILILY